MIDILFPSYKRPEFTAASLAALRANTAAGEYRLVRYEGHKANPVEIMKDFLQRDCSEIFVKLDNDVIVPPGWFAAGLRVMEENPELSFLGIEPPQSRTPAPWHQGPRPIAPETHWTRGLGYVPCDAIGGIGFMRRWAFAGRPLMRAHSGYGGFTEWQQSQRGLVKGWIVPPLPLFLLDRLPIEPWASLSRRYIAEGSQRPWTNYKPEDSRLWQWWLDDRELQTSATEALSVPA